MGLGPDKNKKIILEIKLKENKLKFNMEKKNKNKKMYEIKIRHNLINTKRILN